MKREIKFRGKDKKTGEWFYGNLFDKDTSGRTHIGTTKKGCLDIAPDTVGQYTGLKDKKGKEIYEGDIVYSEFADGSKCMGLVGWNNKLSCFGVMDEYDYLSRQLGYDFPEFDNHFFIEVLKNSKIFKIIGTIYDNPELLTEK